MLLRLPLISPVVLVLLAILRQVKCSGGENDMWVIYERPNGETLYLKDNRRPALYTGNYGDCLGNSLVNVTRFDAAYYRDNMTVLFHLAGDTALHNESLVMYIGVYAYGENRFDLTFNPCNANIASLCPLNSSVPVSANGIIPVAESDVASIPSLALSIPDFEGQAILRIFANSTQSEIGCYSAVISNGHSFAHPKCVGSVLRVFTLVSMIASFATAIYGEAVPTMRLHYAHSLSVGVVFAVFQHIFFTGALSMNWPSVLVAWYRNFAWSGGMIYSASMQNAINHLIGNTIGNTSQVGAAPSDSGSDNVGGGYRIGQIYPRTIVGNLESPRDSRFNGDLVTAIYGGSHAAQILRRELPLFNSSQRHVGHTLHARDYLADKTSGYRWYGRPIGEGMPLPGNYSGFSGTLAEVNIRLSNAFMTGFLWFLILLALVVGFVIAFKCFIVALAKFLVIKKHRLKFFRDHWAGYATVAALRTCTLGFFMVMFLAIFEFSFRSSIGVKLIAAAVFFIFAVGAGGMAAYACYYKKHFTQNDFRHLFERKKLLGIPWAASKKTELGTRMQQPSASEIASNSIWKRMFKAHAMPMLEVVDNIHDDIDYTMKFGWLTSRFRRSQWRFFTVWLSYDFVRAIFYGGASAHPFAQVFGLLIIEILSFAYIIWARPFEGRRLNVLVIYCLGSSKVASVALAAAFDVQFNLPRITTTIIGLVIIVIQGLLTMVTLVAIVVGAVSSYMSISRNHEDFRPRKWHGLREKYFDYLDRVVNDLPHEPKPKKVSKRLSKEQTEREKGFEVKSIKRMAKIEDEDQEFASEMRTQAIAASYLLLDDRAPTPVNASETVFGSQRSTTATPTGRSRASSVNSLSQTNLPPGARPYKPSWCARDFREYRGSSNDTEIRYSTFSDNGVSDDETIISPIASGWNRSRTSSFTNSSRLNAVVLPRNSAESLNLNANINASDNRHRHE